MTTQQQVDMSHMQAVFSPKGIAVVGATERPGSVGRTVVENLIAGLNVDKNAYKLFPVNPTRDTVLGLTCYKSVSAIPKGECDHVVVITPASKCADVARDCVKNESVKVFVCLAAGFKEVGEEGLKLELELVDICSKAGIAVIGPNCLGVQSPNHNVNATFAAKSAKPGSVAFISQSGAMCTAVLDWSLRVGVGFSAFVSIGSMSHVEWSHCIEYLGNDDNTKAILIYMETIGNASEFMRAARKVSTTKPIVVIKAGKTEAAAAAAVSHTGSLAGSHDAFIAAMTRAGCLVCDTIDELQNIAMLLSMQPKPTGDGLYIITNAGGPGVLCTDAAAVAGLNVLDLNEKITETCSEFLPAAWSHHNPLDVLGDAKAIPYAKTLKAVMEHGKPGCSALVVLSPQSVTEPHGTAVEIVKMIEECRKNGCPFDGPVACAWMGGEAVESGMKYLLEHNIPSFSQPDIAAQALGLLWKQVSGASKMSKVVPSVEGNLKEKAMALLAPALKEGRTILTESESKSLMKLYGMDVAQSIVCQNEEEAVKAATELQYPCVIKLNSETITHKSDVGGVKLNIKNDEGVRTAWKEIKANVEKIGPNHFQGVSVQPMLEIGAGVELLVGSSADPQFGPIMLFGTGGCFVEIFKDVAMAIPPLDQVEAQNLIAATKISKAMVPGHGERFKGCPMNDVEGALAKFSLMICDLSDVIAETEINPLLALPNRVIALDARVVLKSNEASAVPLVKPCMMA